MRLFLAIEPERRIRQALGDVITAAARALGPAATALRWVDAGNVHLTLHFLGEVDPRRARTVAGALTSPFSHAPFVVTLDHFGVFPPAGSPRTVWLGAGQGTADLRRVHEELGRRLTSLGFALESRPLSPHITIARARDGERHRGRPILETLSTLTVPALSWTVDHATLFISDLSGPKPQYEEIGRLPIGESAPPA